MELPGVRPSVRPAAPDDAGETVSFSLRREVHHPVMTRRVIPHGGRYYHVLNLTDPAQVDDTVADLLAEAYDLAPE